MSREKNTNGQVFELRFDLNRGKCQKWTWKWQKKLHWKCGIYLPEGVRNKNLQLWWSQWFGTTSSIWEKVVRNSARRVFEHLLLQPSSLIASRRNKHILTRADAWCKNTLLDVAVAGLLGTFDFFSANRVLSFWGVLQRRTFHVGNFWQTHLLSFSVFSNGAKVLYWKITTKGAFQAVWKIPTQILNFSVLNHCKMKF